MEAPIIVHEETNYARLNHAIRTTCAMCLVDVLLKNVPRGFKDIYDAISCKRNQLKRQITIQHFSQLFPFNSLSPAFTVTNCDIPLLYSLIRNVSSVPPPNTGWGQPVIDQPRDNSVGANVERLRERRNHIIHLQEPKVSDHDFNQLWEEIWQSIVDIEVVLGGYEHQQKLESLKTADMDPNCVNREISYVKRVVQEIQEKQKQNQEYILEIQQDQVAHGSILNSIARTQNKHDDILDVLKGGQGNNVTALCNIQTLLNNNHEASEEIKQQITFHSQIIEQGLERLEIKLDQVLDFQGKEKKKDRKIETHDDHKEKEWSNPNKVLYELQKRNENQRKCLEESTISQGCKGQTVIIQDSVQDKESSEDTSVTDNTQQHQTIENSSSPNWTVEEIVMVWPSIETLLLDDLCPKLVISFFDKGNVFSKHECDTIRQTAGRRNMTKELLSRMKDRLPQSFVALFHALNETDQQDISKELKYIIERGPLKEAPVSNSHCFTVKANVMQNGQTLQTVEFQVNSHVSTKVLISLPVTFQIVGSEMGSVIIHLRASGRNSYDAMVAYCKHGGMKNFIMNLLKEKEVFNSLPAGEISIEIQVRQDEEDLNYEGEEKNKDDLAHMTENECSLSCPPIHTADKSHVIKENLILQYECLADEIDPLQFAETFVNRRILDESFFKNLKNYRRGRRAVLFLNEVLDKGNEALCALTEGLKNMGCNELVAKLCFEDRRSKQQLNNVPGNFDGDLVQTQLEVPDKYFGEDLMWSCRLKCAVKKNMHAEPSMAGDSSFSWSTSCSSLDDDRWQKELKIHENRMPSDLKIEYYDVMILYSENNRADAQKFCDHLKNDIKLKNDKSVKAVLYNEFIPQARSLFRHLEIAMEKSTYIFLYITKEFCEDKWIELSREECFMEAIENEEKWWCVVPVNTVNPKDANFKIPMSVKSLKGINYYYNDLFYKNDVRGLIQKRLHQRLEKEKQLQYKQIIWLQNYKRHLNTEMKNVKSLENMEKMETQQEMEQNIKGKSVNEDYLILSKALTGHPLPDDSIQKNIIKVFSSYITEKMSTIQLLPYLIRSSVIVQLEKEMVEAELRNYGNIRAAQLLLLHLPAHVENWYTEFLKALCDSGQKDLAEFIDESFTREYVTRSNTGVIKTDADAQLFLSRKEDISDMDLSDDEIPKEVRMKEEKEEDETERKEMSLENTAYVYDSAGGSLDDLCAAKPRSIKPEFHVAGEDSHVTMTRLKINDPESSDLQAELDQIVLQHKQKLQSSGKIEILQEEDSSYGYDVSLDDSLLAVGSINETSCKHLDDSVYERQTPSVNRDSLLGSVASDDKQEVEIPLRKYQEELARPALQGKNVIIMAPTGSGKTRVAFKLIQEHFQQLREKHAIGKVVLLVKDQALADQHGKTCQELLPKYRSQAINGDIKRDKGISLGDCIEKQDILVVTAQLLLNSLMNREIKSITQFSLMIFDECHHCHDDHAYNKIMQLYRDIKLTPEADISSLPQIIGLTASIGVGKANEICQAKEHIKKIMANMDAELISTVKDNLDELYQHVPVALSDVIQASNPQAEAKDIIINVRPRENDAFHVSITKVMNTIEGMMRDAEVVKNASPEGYITVLNAPSVKGSEAYIQWLSDMWNATVTVPDAKIRRFISPCYTHLKWYNNALVIYNDARVKDAAGYLQKEINVWKEKNMDSNEQCLLMLYKACTRPKYVQEVPNPKLHKLKDLILNSFRDRSTEESRCIVFVKTRHLAKALVDWMNEDSELNTLCPTVFVGTHAVRDKLGLTKVEQSDKLADFRSGRCKIMVATSVAEEGLDIQKCNLVLRYDHVTHEIAMVQSRGRARAMDSGYFVVAQEGKGTAQKEEINMMREELMQLSVSGLKMDIEQDPQAFTKALRQLQDQEKRDREAKQKENRLAEGEYDLRCVACDHFICKSYDIRQIMNSHFVVIDQSFELRVKFRKNRGYEDKEIKFIGKIFCGNCDEDFGQFCIYRLQKLPVIKIDKFVVVGQGGTPKKFKRWKQVPFKVPQLTNEDRKNLKDSQK